MKRKNNKEDRKLKAANMARLRQVRGKQGYTEVVVWIPFEEKEKLRLWAASARGRCQRAFMGLSEEESRDA